MPYLLDTKIKVKFDGIKINTERQLFEGKLVTTYDKTESNVIAINEELKNIKNTILKITNISDVQFDKKTKEVVIKKGNVTETINLSKQKNGSIVVKDENNKEYEITLTTDQKEIEVYALDRGILPSSNDTINNGKFTEKDIEFQRKLIEELKKDIKEKLNPNNFTNEERRYVEGALKYLDFLKVDNVVFTKNIGTLSTGLYDGKLNISYPENSPKDDIKITLFHEYLHHVNYMEKIFPYRYKEENRRIIFNVVDECYLFKEPDIETVFNNYLTINQIDPFDDNWFKQTFNELDEDRKKIIMEYREKNKDIYQKKCHKGIHKPSNYYKDELTVYSICMSNHNIIFYFSSDKRKNYDYWIKEYTQFYKNSLDYEKRENYDSRGFKK